MEQKINMGALSHAAGGTVAEFEFIRIRLDRNLKRDLRIAVAKEMSTVQNWVEAAIAEKLSRQETVR